MPLELSEFPLEYVTGVLRIPELGDQAEDVVTPLVMVTNVGPTAAHTRTLVFRTRRSDLPDEGFDLVLDSATDNGFEGQLISDLVPPGKTWFWVMSDWRAEAGHGTFWFSIRATSPSLIPSLEVMLFEPDLSSKETLRYRPGEFGVIHHGIRVLPPVVPGVGGITQ